MSAKRKDRRKPLPLLKICGNHLSTDLSLIVKYEKEIDYIGFIFTPISKRYIDAALVAKWLQNYPFLREKAVAVFLNQDLSEVTHILKETGIKSVQLHGQESIEYCYQLKAEYAMIEGEKLLVWKVISVEDGQVAPFEKYLPLVDTILLDTKIKDAVGGTGQPFDWTVINQVKKLTKPEGIPLFVAGGITPTNVNRLLSIYQPDGIDLASGVETDLAKDEHKLVNLIKGVKCDGGDQVHLP